MFTVHHVRGVLYGVDEALQGLYRLRGEDINQEALEVRRADLHQIGQQGKSNAHFAESRPVKQ